MSVYAKSTSWSGRCSGGMQSPINLSQSSSKPCDLLCELVFDNAHVSSAKVAISDEGMILQSDSGLGTCKFNGEGYTCRSLLLTHPSHHTVENIQADAEVVAIFSNPSGKLLCVSSLVRVNPHQNNSTHFFNSFIAYANTEVNSTPVNLGDNWGLFMMVPPAGSYFVYDGSMVLPPCQSTTWVVFKNMINMDSNDFALLVKKVSPGSRPIQSQGSREVYFNNIEQLAGGPFPHDNKTYMRCRRIPKKGEDVKPIIKAPVKDERQRQEPPSGITKWTSDQIGKNGILALLDVILMIVAFGMGIYYAYEMSKGDKGTYLITLAQTLALWLRNTWPLSLIFSKSILSSTP